MATSRGQKDHREDTEMADISLITRPEPASESHSWYSANGRGYSVDGRQTEYEGNQSHVATVLGEDFYSKARRNQAIVDFISRKPHPTFNIPSVVLAFLVVVLLLIVASQRSSLDEVPESQSSGVSSDTNVSPEGAFGAKAVDFDYRGWRRQIESKNGAVAADHGRCSVIGVNVLMGGGNAVDSAIATALCQGVMSPGASGLGGGNIMLIRNPNGTAEVINAREVAPAAATETMFVGKPNLSLVGGLAIGVPLELKGLWLAHQRHGTASWQSLVEPAINLAELGFPAQPYLVHAIQTNKNKLEENTALRKVFLIEEKGSWRAPKVNESCCVRPQLAVLLREVASKGPSALYDGAKAEALAAEIQAEGGIITAADLKNAKAVVEPALNSTAFGLDVVLPAPPSSAAAIIAGLHIIEGYPKWLSFAGSLVEHRLVEAMKSAFALRTHFADPGPSCLTNITCNSLMPAILNSTLSASFAETLRLSLLDNTTQATNVYGGVLRANSTVPNDNGTSHVSVVDKNGMAVAITSTVNTNFGSLVYSEATGLLLNNEMDDFSTPGASNTFGLAPSAANFIRPGKRPLSSMSPLILSDSQGVRIVLGASGGPRIISAVLTTLIRLIVFGQQPLEAIAAARLHHQLLPDTVAAESWETSGVSYLTPASTIDALKSRGHNVTLSDWGAVTQVIVVDPTSRILTAASDPRKDGAPQGH